MNKKTAIGIDLGGTRIKAVLIDETGRLLDEEERLTRDAHSQAEAGFTPWQEGIREVFHILKNRAATPVNAVGLAALGLPDKTTTVLLICREDFRGLRVLCGPIFWGWKNFR
ncbi:MAG: hypothetical protein R3C61_10145 [Bacteroidia bacterium]